MSNNVLISNGGSNATWGHSCWDNACQQNANQQSNAAQQQMAQIGFSAALPMHFQTPATNLLLLLLED